MALKSFWHNRNCPQLRDGALMQIDAHDVLLVTDVQNDFCPGGALAVPRGDEIIAPIHRVAPQFAHIVLIQDWHPANHSSFAASHPGKQPFESIELGYGAQTLWPVHCVQGSHGAEFHPSLHLPQAELDPAQGLSASTLIPIRRSLRMTAQHPPVWPAICASATLRAFFWPVSPTTIALATPHSMRAASACPHSSCAMPAAPST